MKLWIYVHSRSSPLVFGLIPRLDMQRLRSVHANLSKKKPTCTTSTYLTATMNSFFLKKSFLKLTFILNFYMKTKNKLTGFYSLSMAHAV